MATTGQQICDKARLQINDDLKREVPDTELLEYANQCARAIFLRRPDLRMGSFATPITDIALGGNFPFDDLFIPAVIGYVVAMGNLPDDEDTVQALADKNMAIFLKSLYGD